MSPQTPPPPDNNNANPQTGYSIKPLFFGSGLMCALLMTSFWVYIEHPEWLEGSNAEDDRVEKLLEANPDLTLEDLEADVQSGNLSFWLRTDPENSPRANTQDRNKKNKEPDPLEVFMKKKREEAKNKKKDSNSKNPLLNFSALEDLNRDSQNQPDNPIGKINLDALSLSTPLDRMLQGEAGNNKLTPLEAEILSLQQSPPTTTENVRQPQENPLSLPSENATGQNNFAPNSPVNQTANDPNNLLPNATNNLNTTVPGFASTRPRTTAQPSLNQTTRRDANNPALNGVNGMNGVVPTTPVIPPQNSRRDFVSPRIATPSSTTTTPNSNNTVSPLNDPYSQAQPARINQPALAPRPVNPNNRIGAGEINSFSNPYGAGQ